MKINLSKNMFPLILFLFCFHYANCLTEMADVFAEFDQMYYGEDGLPFLNGKTIGNSDEIRLFFKADSTKCTPNFSIKYCLKKGSKCTNGLTICYESELNVLKVQSNFTLPRVLNNDKVNVENGKSANPESVNAIKFDCSEQSSSAFKIYTDDDGTNFMIAASIDRHIYKFPISLGTSTNDETCFRIQFSSTNLISTTITNLNGKKLIFIGDPPASFVDNGFKYAGKTTTMNLWQLGIDFVPLFPEFRHFMSKAFSFVGGGQECGLVAKIEGDNIEPCMVTTKSLAGCSANSDDFCRAPLAYSNEFDGLKQNVEKDYSNELKSLGLEAKDVDVDKFYKNDLKEAKKQFEYTWGFNKQMLSAEINHEGIIETYTKQKKCANKCDGIQGTHETSKVGLGKIVLNCAGLSLYTKSTHLDSDESQLQQPPKNVEVEWEKQLQNAVTIPGIDVHDY